MAKEYQMQHASVAERSLKEHLPDNCRRHSHMQMSRDTGEDRPYMAYDMDDHMDWNEIEFLSSMFCQPGEFNVQGDTVTIITRLDLSKEMGTSAESDTDSVKVPVKMVFTVGQGYPKIIPDIHIHSEHLNDENIFKIKSHVFENIGPDFLDMPMLLPLSGLIRDAARVELATVFRNRGPASDETDKEVDTVRRSSSENNDEEVASKRVRSGNDGAEGATSGARDSWSAVLHIDHMRSKNKYCKTLEKWALQLALTGRIVFLRRLILVLLQGCQENVKGFIVRLKTCTVDVDSKGHGCKEKMMKVLSEGESQSSYGLVSFTRCELTKESELRALISESGLDGHWENILPLLKQHH